MWGIVKACRRPRRFASATGGGFPRLSAGVARGLRCPASPRHALLAENLGKPSPWVNIKDLWYHWAPELPCRPTERPQRDLVLRPGSRPVAADASAPQPTAMHERGEDAPSRRSILPADRDPRSDALSPLRRQNPREEPGAFAARSRDLRGGSGATRFPTVTVRESSKMCLSLPSACI